MCIRDRNIPLHALFIPYQAACKALSHLSRHLCKHTSEDYEAIPNQRHCSNRPPAIYIPAAVSYTHLDVYKRQTLAKQKNLDAIHDTVHEMAKDEARHGAAFEGLLKRYFG